MKWEYRWFHSLSISVFFTSVIAQNIVSILKICCRTDWFIMVVISSCIVLILSDLFSLRFVFLVVVSLLWITLFCAVATQQKAQIKRRNCHCVGQMRHLLPFHLCSVFSYFTSFPFCRLQVEWKLKFSFENYYIQLNVKPGKNTCV